MALNIANPRVERKAAEAGRILGVNKTAAVEAALDLLLEQAQARGGRTHRAELSRLFDELAALPVLDSRPTDEILGYDEHGLPS